MRLISWMVGILMTAGHVWAQQLKVDPSSRAGDDKSTGILWLITAIFVVACLVVAFKPAKRSKLE
ncbi:MAG: hypothetical protein HY718_02920 [Planctomycetes bacterium]|nr:hypothetical protein [Planctomycetota bacterium]